MWTPHLPAGLVTTWCYLLVAFHLHMVRVETCLFFNELSAYRVFSEVTYKMNFF
jgi:hypothetical protein